MTNMNLSELGQKAKEACRKTARLGENEKNKALLKIAEYLVKYSDEIISANKEDVEAFKKEGKKQSLIDRLSLSKERIEQMAGGVRDVAALPDPIGKVYGMDKRPNGLVIGKKCVPIGVICIIYEARPNVTADAAALCLKTGNACILKGGKEALRSNMKIVEIIKRALKSSDVTSDAVQLVSDTNRETTTALMKMNEYIDVLIPRGGAGLIRAVVENATVPVIETGTGNCHIYIEKTAGKEMSKDITVNAKTSRPSVCNAAESLLIDKEIAAEFLPEIASELKERGVEIRGCEKTKAILPEICDATEEDYYTEYNDLIISVKVVDGINEAIEHINEHGTGHSEAIVTNDYSAANKFLEEIDAACVYVNASTRFTDGFEFGFGAEIGISTQKLHARGPMGLSALTTTKYIIYGNGQIR